MVGGGSPGLQELDAAAGVGGSGGHHPGEVGRGDVVGAGAGDEGASGAEHAHGPEVELPVAAEGTLDGAAGLGEGGWVEDDRVVAFPGGVELPEYVEDVSLDPVQVGEAVAPGVGVGHLECGAALVHAGDVLADAGEVEGESSLVGAAVEGSSAGVAGGGLVVMALVKEGAGLLAGGGVVAEAEAVEGEDGVEGGFGAGGEEGLAGAGCELLQFPDSWVGAFEDGCDSGQSGEDGGEGGADVVLGSCLGEELDDDEVVVAVDDDAGEVVCLGEDEAGGVAACEVVGGCDAELVAKRDGGVEADAEELEEGCAVECGFGGDEPDGDLGGGAIDAGADGSGFGVEDGDDGSGRNGGGFCPGMELVEV